VRSTSARPAQRDQRATPKEVRQALPQEPPAPRKLVVCRSDGHCVQEIDPSEISEHLKKEGEFVWLDIQDPLEEDILLLQEEFGFHPLAVEDATRHHERPKVASYTDYYFLVFYALRYDTKQNRLAIQPMNLFVGANYMVSVHKGAIAAVGDTIQRWQQQEEPLGNDAGTLLYQLLDAIVDDYFPVIDQLSERMEAIEERIFARFYEAGMQEVFALKHDLIAVRRIAAPERDVLNVLIRREVPIFDHGTILYLQDVYDHIVRITDSIDTYRDLLSSALDAYLSVQSNQLNQIVKVLTIASIILMSNALIAGIYGMNFTFMPELDWRLGYPFALGLMGVSTIGLILFFRWRKWL
jgi:magnesium transporter